MLYSGQQLWLLLKSLGILSSTLWKTKEITSLIISSKKAALMGSTDKMSVTVQKTTFAGDSLKCIIQENTKKWPVKKKNKIEELTLLDFKAYYKITAIKIVWYCHKNRQIDQ